MIIVLKIGFTKTYFYGAEFTLNLNNGCEIMFDYKSEGFKLVIINCAPI